MNSSKQMSLIRKDWSPYGQTTPGSNHALSSTYSLISPCMQLWFASVVPKYLNLATFLKNIPIICSLSALPTNAETFNNKQNHKSQIKYEPETSKVYVTEFVATICCSIK
jgi:hypothetical protein